MKLPNAEDSIVDIIKLTGYCLNPTHPRGRHKARVFQSALGFDQNDAGMLKTLLLKAARESDAVAVEEDEFGQRYIIDFQIGGPRGTANIRSSWITLNGEVAPRFVSCYVL